MLCVRFVTQSVTGCIPTQSVGTIKKKGWATQVAHPFYMADQAWISWRK